MPAATSTVSGEVLGTTTTATSTGTTEQSIRIGMTKSQVIAIWGEPSGRQVTPREEVWSYGAQRWMRQIPYAGPFINVNTSKVVFVGGRVVDFRNTNEGDMMSADIGYGAGRFSNY